MLSAAPRAAAGSAFCCWSALAVDEGEQYAAFAAAVIVVLLRHGQAPMRHPAAGAPARTGVAIADVIARSDPSGLMALLIAGDPVTARLANPLGTLALRTTAYRSSELGTFRPAALHGLAAARSDP